MEYADLSVVDLSKFSTPDGRTELAVLARDAMRTQGFFYVINHGMSSEQVSADVLLCSSRGNALTLLYGC